MSNADLARATQEELRPPCDRQFDPETPKTTLEPACTWRAHCAQHRLVCDAFIAYTRTRTKCWAQVLALTSQRAKNFQQWEAVKTFRDDD